MTGRHFRHLVLDVGKSAERWRDEGGAAYVEQERGRHTAREVERNKRNYTRTHATGQNGETEDAG